MHETLLKPGWETALFAIAFIGLSFLAILRVNFLSGVSKKAGQLRRPASGTDSEGVAYYTDPDGKRWKERRKVKRSESARLDSSGPKRRRADDKPLV